MLQSSPLLLRPTPAAWRGLVGLITLLFILAAASFRPAANFIARSGQALITRPTDAPAWPVAHLPGLPGTRLAGTAAVASANPATSGMAAVWADVRRRSYFVDATTTAGTWQADNAAQRLSATLSGTAYAVAAPLDSTASAQHRAPAWSVRLALRGIGRANRVAFAPAATPAAHIAENKAVFAHGAAFAVDYANGPAGLRQNYTLAQRPTGTGPVQVLLALTTALNVQPDGSQALAFATADGHKVLRYAGLKAWDANGRVLRAQLALAANGHTLALNVDDAGATYPLTVDPLFSTALDATTGENATDSHGFSVAGAGDVNADGYADIVVGAYAWSSSTGRAYVYYGSSTGLSTTITATTLTGENPGDNFGVAVAGAGDVNGDGYGDVIIGAHAYSTPSSNTGKTYVYYGSSAGLNTTTYSTETGESGSSYFGRAVAGAGDVNADGYADVVVGANGHNGDTGKAYVYYGSSTGLSAVLPYSFKTGEAGANYFGIAVAGAGDVNADGYADIIVGAYGNGTTNTGKAYVYLGSSTGLSATAPTTKTGEAPNDYFGNTVAGAGDVNADGYADVIVGAANNSVNTGRAYVYYGSSSGLNATAVNTRSGETAADYFGSSVAGAGDVNADGYGDVIVGAFGNGVSSTGKAYVYYGSSTGLSATLTAGAQTGQTTNSYFGISVAGAGDVNGDGYADVIIGANGDATITGKAYMYYGSPGLLAPLPPAGLAGSQSGKAGNDKFGYSVAGASDVNGDGYADVIIGVPSNNSNTGKAYVYYGSSDGLSIAISPSTLIGDATNNYFGASVAGAGDVNGDGYGDVMVGAYGNASYTGKTYLYYGSSAGLSTTITPSIQIGENTNDQFGFSVAGAGDVNADGYADVIVGAPYNASSTGKAYVYYGSSTGLNTTISSSTRAGSSNSNFGISVAGAGDLNGDGYADVIIGASQDNSYTGTAYEYYGSGTGLSATTTMQTGEAINDQFSSSVAGAGDVNGDGYADVIIGANGNASNTGKIYVYFGSSAGLSTTFTTQTGEVSNNYFGASVAGASDVNGDGYADVLVGAWGNGTGNTGKTFLYYGSSAGLSSTLTPSTQTGENTNDQFGFSVAGAGDVNGDGYADIVIGAIGHTSDTGKSYLYLGNDGVARAGALRVLNTDLSTLLNASNRPVSQFGIGLTARPATGRMLARLVWETAANGIAFSHASPLANSTAYTGRGAWTDLPATSTTELKSLVSKVGRATRVRARIEYASASPLAGTTAPNGTGGTGSQARYGPWTYVISQQLGYLTAMPLPVALSAFTATLTPAGTIVRLAWATASEKNSQAFEVERSTNGLAFERLTTVPAAGFSSASRAYAFADEHLPAATTLYYRLHLVDTDGTATYSPVRSVARTTNSPSALDLSAYPNPTHNTVQVAGATPNLPLLLLDAQGRRVATFPASAVTAAGTATVALPAGLVPGLYLLRSGTRTQRIVIE